VSARALVRRWRARKPGWATVGGELFLLRYPFSRFDSGPEAAMLAAFTDELAPGLVVFDVGANAGIYTLLAARRGAHAVAFEPSSAAVALLRQHLALNELDAEIVEACAADADGELPFFEQGAASTSSLSEASARTGELLLDEPVVATMRPSVRIDTYCAQAGVWPDVVKLDVEGAEARALAGAATWLGRRRGVLFLELHPWSLAQLGASEEDVLRLLREAGWQTEVLEDNGNTRHLRASP
jgi:FkbM family methyltransferase